MDFKKIKCLLGIGGKKKQSFESIKCDFEQQAENNMNKEPHPIVKAFGYIFLKKKKNDEWAQLINELKNRKESIEYIENELKNSYCHLSAHHRLFIATTEVFVEKAQGVLTSKANIFFVFATIISFSAFAVLLFMGLYLMDWYFPFGGEFNAVRAQDLNASIHIFKDDSYNFSALILKRIAGGGFIAGLAIYLIALARAFFHESTMYKNIRHALRFGRLYVYLKDPKELTIEELERAFHWNDTFGSSFKDIRPELSGKTLLTYTIEAIKAVDIPKIVEATTKAKTAAKDEK